MTCVILYTDKAYTKKIEKIDIDNFKVNVFIGSVQVEITSHKE